MNNKIKLAVIGSRGFSDSKRLYKILDKNIDRIEMIVSGGAKGTDSIAANWCKERGVPILIFWPKWKNPDGSTDRGAGMKRNWNIMKMADKALIVWDKISTGTKNDIEICEKLKKPHKIIYF